MVPAGDHIDDDTNPYVFAVILLETVILGAVTVNQIYRNSSAIFPDLPLETVCGASCQSDGSVKPSVGLAVLRTVYAGIHTYENIVDNFLRGLSIPFFSKNPFRYFTVWNYVLQNIYVILAATVSILALCRLQPLERARRLVFPLFEVCFPMSCFVSIIFWTVLAKPEDWTTPRMILQHFVNTVFFCTAFASNRFLQDMATCSLTIMWVLLYLWFAWIAHWYVASCAECSGSPLLWPYFFLAMKDWTALLWYNALILAVVLADAAFAQISKVTKEKWMGGSKEPSGWVSPYSALVQ